MDNQTVLEILKRCKPEIQEKFHVASLGLFGSYARDQQASDSDIDILYELEEGATFGLKEIDDFEQYLKEILSVEAIDLVNKEYINPVIELEIEDDLIYV